MTVSANNQRYLDFMRDIYEVSQACATTTYVWGGFTLDIVEGRFLREHHDLDVFTLNMLEVLPDFSTRYAQRGYAVEFLHDFDMLTIGKDGLHATFNRLEIDGETAMWRHIGNQGTVFFPAHWLDRAPTDFYGVPVYTAGIRFAFLLKTNSHLLNPAWTPRPRDGEDITRLEQLLARDNLDQETFLPRAWSVNPYWAQRGYPEHAQPVMALPFRS